MTIASFADAKMKAEQASVLASDTGAYSFANHAGYEKSIPANLAAQKAWKRVNQEAQALLKISSVPILVEEASDALVRVGELEVAYKMLMADVGAHVSIPFGPLTPAAAAAESSWGLPSLSDEQVETAQKVGIVALIVAAGVWIFRRAA